MFLLPLIFSLLLPSFKEQLAVTKAPVPSTVNKTVLLQLVNDARKKGCNCGDAYYAPVAPLTWNEQLEKAAYGHSNDMSQKKYFSHIASDGSSPSERITRAGYSWEYYGENIAMGYDTEQDVINGWLSSPGHCKNIMNKNFTEMGISKVGDYWTQDFGTK